MEEIDWTGRMRVLFSYHYFQGTDLVEKVRKVFPAPPEVFVDSGAFSAKTQGEEINLPSYCQFIRDNAEVIDWYANLDVIGSAEKTWGNQKEMEKRGLDPIPVFHVNEDWEYLERYVDEYPLVALGGLVPHMRYTERVMPWLVKAFRIGEGRCVFHGFGVTSWEVLKSLPWYSVDSSAWGAGFRFGKVPVFDPSQKGFHKVQLGSQDAYQCAELIREYGFSPQDFADRTRNTREHNAAIAALSYMRAESWLRERHGSVLPKNGDVRSELGIFLGDENRQMSRFAEAVEGAKRNGVSLFLVDPSPQMSDWGPAIDGIQKTGPKIFLKDKDPKNFELASEAVAESDVHD